MLKTTVDWLKTDTGKKLPLLLFGVGSGCVLLALITAVTIIYATSQSTDYPPAIAMVLLGTGYLAEAAYVAGLSCLLISAGFLVARKVKQFRRRKH
jgi:hypothetical protein